MNLKLPLKAKTTERILKSVLPEHFKMVQDQTSNGYKFINLLYGAEFDQLERIINRVYDDSSITTFNLSDENALYEAYISGIPNTQYLNKNSTPIKITDEIEFYYGEPTRLIPLSGTLPILMYTVPYTGSVTVTGLHNGFDKGFNTPCWSNITGVVGLEYMRSDLRGSGYLIVSSDIDQAEAFISGKWPTFAIEVGSNLKSSGNYKNTYGIFTGIADISSSGNAALEVLTPFNEQTLRQQYPFTREIIDASGITRTIDHFTPYNGYKVLPGGVVVANIDDPNGYTFNEEGKKIYFRTAYNNPYGYNNFSGAYLPLDFVPISGTLKVFDIDILDISGNAIEIPSTGKNLYYYKSPKMFLGLSGEVSGIFDPVYVGYQQIVPSGYNYGSIQGKTATLLKTTTWKYLHDGLKFDDDTLSWIDGTGSIINAIYISGFNSRYMVEYKTKVYDSVRYFSSLNSNGLVSYLTTGPLTTLGTNNLTPIDYEFTRDPNLGSSNTKFITLDGLKFRPNSLIDQISFNIPIIWEEGNLTGPLYKNIKSLYAGYSNEFIPNISSRRYDIIDCYFNSKTNYESNILNPASNFVYVGNDPKLLINYTRTFGKKIIGSGSYFNFDTDIKISPNIHFVFDCTIYAQQSGTFLEASNNSNKRDIKFDLEKAGFLKVYSRNRIFTSKDPIQFNSKKKSFILRYVSDELSYDASAATPDFNIYLKEEGDAWYKPIPLSKTAKTDSVISSDYFHIYKNFSIDIGGFKAYYDIYEDQE